MAYRDWYYKDWTTQDSVTPTGRRSVRSTYTGLYYQLPDRTRLFKAVCFGEILLYFLLFLYLNIFASPGGLTPRVNAAGMLNLIPLLFCLAAAPALRTAPRTMTYRRYRRCIWRLRFAGVFATAALTVQTVFEILYIAANGISGELRYLIVLVVDLLLAGVSAFVILKMDFPTTDRSDVPLPKDE